MTFFTEKGALSSENKQPSHWLLSNRVNFNNEWSNQVSRCLRIQAVYVTVQCLHCDYISLVRASMSGQEHRLIDKTDKLL
jgi:predicted nucleic-acid-binding Zn-ribbon protein